MAILLYCLNVCMFNTINFPFYPRIIYIWKSLCSLCNYSSYLRYGSMIIVLYILCHTFILFLYYISFFLLLLLIVANKMILILESLLTLWIIRDDDHTSFRTSNELVINIEYLYTISLCGWYVIGVACKCILNLLWSVKRHYFDLHLVVITACICWSHYGYVLHWVNKEFYIRRFVLHVNK